MRMENLKAKEPDAVNVVKARITAYSKGDAERAAVTLAKGWTHHMIKQIRTMIPKTPMNQELTVYYVLMWN